MLPVVDKTQGFAWYQATFPNLKRHFRKMPLELIFKEAERLREPQICISPKQLEVLLLLHSQAHLSSSSEAIFSFLGNCSLLWWKVTHFILEPALTIHSLLPILFNYTIICLFPKNNYLSWNRTDWYWTILLLEIFILNQHLVFTGSPILQTRTSSTCIRICTG